MVVVVAAAAVVDYYCWLIVMTVVVVVVVDVCRYGYSATGCMTTITIPRVLLCTLISLTVLII